MNTQKEAISPQLYLLTNDEPFDLLYKKLEVALATTSASNVIGLLQIRRKQVLQQAHTQKASQEILYAQASRIIELADKHRVRTVINDDMNLAKRLGVGVHLGQGDGSLMDARQELGTDAIIGRTCHSHIELVKTAHQQGASYAAMGALFHSTTKPNAISLGQLGIDTLTEATSLPIDICVIGGITLENIHSIKSIRLKYIAVVSDILNRPADTIAERCLQWQHMLADWHS